MKKSKSFEGAILGEARLSVSSDDLIPLLNVLLEIGASYRNILRGDGAASVDLSYPAARIAKRRCRERGIEADAELYFGLPYLFRRLLGRPGLIVGIIAAALIVYLSGAVIWDVRVSCDGDVSSDGVMELLSAHGVYPGARKSSLDVGRIQADIESESRDIAWISVNIIGTVAYVEVIGEVIPPTREELYDGINLVASCDGVLTGFEVISGEPAAEVGMTVKKGELLVSGLCDSKRFGYRAVEAEGSVFARTEEVFEVEIPLRYTVRTPEKSEICEISLIFFALRQKLFKKGGFLSVSYDIIYSDIYIYADGEKTLPVGLSVGRRNIYSEQVVTRTAEEAAELAYLEINRQMLSALPDAEILSRSYGGATTADGSAYRLVCRVSCIRNIAEEKPFNINPSE